MFKEMEKAGLPAPEYKDVAFMLHTTIRNGINVVDNVADNHAAVIKLSATEQEILEHLQNSSTLSAKEFASLLHKTPRTIQRNITALREKGLLRREDSDRKGKWILLK
ncbi:hypothetical protein C805_03676 [Eubacterium sp. 14-2]|uniref:HVO_A0114 family putative DNA-binding protein n=1 Tax=Eubacterium sp. 14-2 TaxID=1235790 RepID=UPI00033BF01B|nr:HTH domain-containing protein [Eubacterium sp. 14-2]EOT21598.1 hypothetical protein C805_03676 [Eubacterium sp. 14-2]